MKKKEDRTRFIKFGVRINPWRDDLWIPVKALKEPVVLESPCTKVPGKWVLVNTETGRIIHFKSDGSYE